MFHVGGLAPIAELACYFLHYESEKVPYAIKHFTNETKRLYSVLNNALEGKDYLVGNIYTLADIINYPWIRSHFMWGIPNLDDYSNLKAWIARIDPRPAVQKGLNVPNPDKVKEFSENPEKFEEFIKFVRREIFKYPE